MNVFSRIGAILWRPKVEWQKISTENTGFLRLLFGYVLPVALVSALSVFIPLILYGTGEFSYFSRLFLMRFLSGVGFVFLFSFVAGISAPAFNSKRGFTSSLQLICYSATPIFLTGIFNGVPYLSWIATVSGWLYFILLLYLGMGPVKNTAPGRKIGWLFFLSITAIVLYSAISGLFLVLLKWD